VGFSPFLGMALLPIWLPEGTNHLFTIKHPIRVYPDKDKLIENGHSLHFL
jgi:hypothetical protein